MLTRQCKDTFIRKFGDAGYINNQLTKHDRVYNDVGGVFLDNISRAPKKVESIIKNLHKFFTGVSEDTIRQDFIEFVADLEKDKFVVMGESEEELNQKEPFFSYHMENPKTIVSNFLQPDKHLVLMDTAEFFYQKFRKNPTIFSAEIELTSRCNERCVHCYIPHENKNRDIEKSFVLDVLDQLKELGTLGITFTGGELFLHKDVVDIMYHARKNDFSITILSNITLLNDDLIRVLKDINISQIQVSVYSMKAEEHDVITQLKGSYTTTIRNLEKLIAADIPAQISCPVMKINKNSYKDVLKWAYDHKIKAYCDFVMMAKTNFDTSNLNDRINKQEAYTLINDIIENDEQYRTLLDIAPKSKDFEKFAKQPVCGVGVDNICMTADGNFYPCAGWQGYVLGNAYQQRVKDIWDYSERLKYLRTITNASFTECMICGALDYCSICLVRNFNESGGNMFKISENLCQVAYLNKKLVEEYKTKREHAAQNA